MMPNQSFFSAENDDICGSVFANQSIMPASDLFSDAESIICLCGRATVFVIQESCAVAFSGRQEKVSVKPQRSGRLFHYSNRTFSGSGNRAGQNKRIDRENVGRSEEKYHHTKSLTVSGCIAQSDTRRKRIYLAIAMKKAMVTILFTGMRLLILDILPHERKFNQDSFLGFIAPELGNENARAKRRLDSKQLVVHIVNSMRQNGGKIEQYFV
jgi:hypothetical protein